MMKLFSLVSLLVFPLTLLGEPHPGKLQAQLFEHEGKSYVAMTLKHEPGWHTYWKNPGDAGLPTQFEVQVNNATPEKMATLEWPTPKRYVEAGDILAYGYGDELTFFAETPEPFSLKVISSTSARMQIMVKWLICKDVCIPGKGQIDIGVTIPSMKKVIESEKTSYSQSELLQKFKNLPQKSAWPKDLEVYLSKKAEGGLVFHAVVNSYEKKRDFKYHNLLTPFLSPPLGFKKEKLYDDKKTLYSEMDVEWDGDYLEPPRPLPTDGKLVPPLNVSFLYFDPMDGQHKIIEKEFTSFSMTDSGVKNLLKNLAPAKLSIQDESEVNFWHFYLLAFLGGLILNLMPCVLPVISLKLFGLIKYQNQPQKVVLKHNLAYTMGVLISFWILAASILVIKNAGTSIGWGFQLQSPEFVLFMTILLFVMGLNLFGLFEFATPGGKMFASTSNQTGFLPDVFSGMLSTLLSTPCSAPFLGTALTFAFTSTPLQIFMTFTLIGVGLATPFLLTALIPKILYFLPKPGAWMEKLKYFLGLTMMLTVIWLADVFLSLVDKDLWFFPLMTIFLLIFFALFAQKKFKHPAITKVFLILPILFVFYALKEFQTTAPMNKKEAAASVWQTWSEKQMTDQSGWVFVDFTAEWCLTCKVNKKLVLDTDDFKTYVDEKKLSLMRADWTHRDEAITQFLGKHKIVGVPAYFLKKPDGEVVSLGETITIGKIKSYIQ
jgi:thiol:disulfide interchange protein/DsbC/DsbD-like thiol-disulfide interchange protein